MKNVLILIFIFLTACGSPEHDQLMVEKPQQDQHKPNSQASAAQCVNDPSLPFECLETPIKPGF
jgi:uncharacterized lipoprotein YmbA